MKEFVGIGIKKVYFEQARTEVIARAVYRLLQELSEKKLIAIPVNDYQVTEKDGVVYFNFEFED
jgi:hypothetical protein